MAKGVPIVVKVTFFTKTEHGGIFSEESRNAAIENALPKKAYVVAWPNDYAYSKMYGQDVSIDDVPICFPSTYSYVKWAGRRPFRSRKHPNDLWGTYRLRDYCIEG